MISPLTPKQYELLKRVEAFPLLHPYPPIVEDVTTGENPKTTLQRLIRLEQLGYIEIVRARRRIRAILLLWKL